MLPQIAQGDANKVWIVPSEITQALGNIGSMWPKDDGEERPKPPPPPR